MLSRMFRLSLLPRTSTLTFIKGGDYRDVKIPAAATRPFLRGSQNQNGYSACTISQHPLLIGMPPCHPNPGICNLQCFWPCHPPHPQVTASPCASVHSVPSSTRTTLGNRLPCRQELGGWMPICQSSRDTCPECLPRLVPDELRALPWPITLGLPLALRVWVALCSELCFIWEAAKSAWRKRAPQRF